MKVIATNDAPQAIGPYSQAIVVGNMVYTSGQIPLCPLSGVVVGENIAEQAKQVCKNLKAVLEASGSGLNKVVKTTCFLANINDFAEFNKVYANYFVSKPARSCVAVKTLPKNVLVEVEAIGVVENDGCKQV